MSFKLKYVEHFEVFLLILFQLVKYLCDCSSDMIFLASVHPYFDEVKLEKLRI